MDAFNSWSSPSHSAAELHYMHEIARLFGCNFNLSTPPPRPVAPPSPPKDLNQYHHFSTVDSLHNNGYGLFNRQRLNSAGSLTSVYSSSDESGSLYTSPESSPPMSPGLGSPVMGSFSSWDIAPSNPWDDFATNGIDHDLDEIDKIMRRNDLEKNVRSSTLGQGRAAELLDMKEPTALMRNRLLQLILEAEKNKKNGRNNKKVAKVCVFCKNNGECESVYSCHSIKDDKGRVTCPILYCYKCPKCGASGENAHTLKYCPLSTDTYVVSKAVRSTARTAAGKRRFPAVA